MLGRGGLIALLVAFAGCSSVGDGGGAGGTSGNASGGAAAGSAGTTTGVAGNVGLAGSTGAAGIGGPCSSDADCVFNLTSGCCGACLAKTDPVPPPLPCDAVCGARPSCLCLEGRCREGTLTSGMSCDERRSQCGRDLLCCALCSPIPDGGGCSSPRCTKPLPSGGTLPVCPQPP